MLLPVFSFLLCLSFVSHGKVESCSPASTSTVSRLSPSFFSPLLCWQRWPFLGKLEQWHAVMLPCYSIAWSALFGWLKKWKICFGLHIKYSGKAQLTLIFLHLYPFNHHSHCTKYPRVCISKHNAPYGCREDFSGGRGSFPPNSCFTPPAT